MGVGLAIFELEDVLKSKRDKITSEEENILMSCQSKATNHFLAGGSGAIAVVWAATRKLKPFFRRPFTAAAGTIFGLWSLNRSLNSSVDHILTLDGSRLQKELANIMVTKFPEDPRTTQFFSKRFYPEKVFDDSNDQLKLRWRSQNLYSDDVVRGQNVQDGDSHDDSNSNNSSYTKNYSQSKRTNLQTRRIVQRNPGLNAMAEADPLDCVFGYSAPMEEIHDPNTPTKPQGGVHNRAHRRSHRRRRMRHLEGLPKLDHAAPA